MPENQNTTPLLTVIISVRESSEVNVTERLSWRERYIRDAVELIVVDDGSPERHAESIESACNRIGARYIRLETRDAPFSLARARNAGIRAATAPNLYFEDIDLVGTRDFYQRLVSAAELLELVPFNFLAIPIMNLTANASAELLATSDFETTFQKYIGQLGFINPDEPNDIVENFAPVGSNILVRRSTCYHVGLFDEYFNFWGGEDREFIFRLLFHNSRLMRPESFHVTKPWRIHRTNAYEGWRAVYRLHGEWAQRMGLYVAHIHHPSYPWKTQYYRTANFKYCDDKIAAIHGRKIKLQPARIDSNHGDHTVFVGRNPTFYNDDVMDVLGSVTMIEPAQSVPAPEFVDTIVAHEPTRVVIRNPYSSKWLAEVQAILRHKGIPCFCAERGALPHSIYFDPNGFCADSSSYSAEHWKDAVPVDARAYVDNLRTTSLSLEPQGVAPVDTIRKRLLSNRRTVLVLLQSLTDVTTQHFTKPLKNYDEFLSLIRRLIALNEFNVIVKNHPLNKSMPIQAGIDGSQVNVYELLQLADVCVTLNSGAGLLALGAGCPVVTMGSCFYAQAGLAESAASLSELRSVLERAEAPERSPVDRFFGYLINDFYSFADWDYGVRSQSEHTNMSLMTNIRYREIRIANLRKTVRRGVQQRHSLLMDPFALYMFLRSNADGNASGSRTSQSEATEKAPERTPSNAMPTSKRASVRSIRPAPTPVATPTSVEGPTSAISEPPATGPRPRAVDERKRPLLHPLRQLLGSLR